MEKMRSRICAFLALVMLVGCFASPCGTVCSASSDSYEAVESREGFSLMLENEKLSLYVDSSNGQIKIYDKTNGIDYFSNPQDINSLKGSARTAAQSQLLIKLYDKQGNVTVANSLVEAVNRNGFKVYKNSNSIKCVYRFQNYKVEIPVVYRITNDSFQAEIAVSKIRSDDPQCYLQEISLLPYFASASPADDGCFVVPDGCGSLIHFSDKKICDYSQSLYGADRGMTSRKRLVNEQPALLPVIGTLFSSYQGKGECGILAYASYGDALATCYASLNSGYANSYFGFTYRALDEITLMDQTSSAQNVFLSEKKPVSCKKFSVSYSFLNANKATLTGLADAVREKLFGENIPAVKETNLPVYINSYLSVRKTKYFLGIPYNGNQKLTTLSDCDKMINDFNSVPVVMALYGINSNGAVGGTIDKKFSVMGSIGSKKEFKTLCDNAKQAGGAVYPVTQFTEFNKSSSGYRIFSSAVMSVANLTVKREFVNYGTKESKAEYGTICILKNNKILPAVENWISSAKKQQVSTCAPISISNEPYRSGAEKGMDRSGTQNIFNSCYKSFKNQKIDLMLSCAAAFAVPYAEHISSMPTSSSGFSACDEEVPFLQMVLHGVKSYSCPPVNLSGDTAYSYLKAIETGSSLCYSFTASEYSVISETALDVLNGSEYERWKKKASDDAASLASVMKGTISAKINDYRVITNDVRYVSYENGSSFLINYGNEPYTYKGVTVDPVDYIQMKGEKTE